MQRAGWSGFDVQGAHLLGGACSPRPKDGRPTGQLALASIEVFRTYSMFDCMCIRMCPCGLRQVIAASVDGTVKYWDVRKMRYYNSIQVRKSGNYPISVTYLS